ncbi:ATP-binding protein [Actinomadura craniellae]|nr:ATP-binding protein [Actinomadura craniellae]
MMTLRDRYEDVAHARRFVAATLHDHPGRETAVLLTSELVTNSIVHGEGLVTVAVVSVCDGVRVEVGDGGSGTVPRPRIATDSAENGRGLFLVEHLADRWDHVRGAAGLTTWFELANGA